MPLVAIFGEDAGILAQQISQLRLGDLELLVATGERVATAQADILLGPPQEIAACLDEATNLRWVQSTWAGVKPLIEHPRRDYLLTGVKGIFGQAMSEYLLGWLLALERGIIRRAVQSHWDPVIERGLAGRRLGIMGTGSISLDVAMACRALGLTVTGLNSDGREVKGFSDCYATVDRLVFAEKLDYLVALLPDTPGTDNLVDSALLSRLSRGAVLINAGRANSVVDEDVLAALSSGQLSAAVLDVTREEPLPPEHPFWQVRNLYLSSHTAAPSSPDAVVRVFADNYRRYCAQQSLQHQVDFDRGY